MTDAFTVPTVRNISNSETITFLACKRQYFYAFVWELAPKRMADPLARGGIGHEAFEYYVKARLNSSSHELAMQAGLEVFERALQSGLYSIEIVMQTRMLWIRYMGYHQGWPAWKMLGTEERKELQLTDSLKMVIRYDLYLEEISSGRKGILDYKYTYDFWRQDDHDLNPQMPKYIGVMRLNGYQVDFGLLEEIRTRKLSAASEKDPKKTWKRTSYYPPPAQIKATFRQHVGTALEIERFRSQTEDQMRAEAAGQLPLNKHGACKYCAFTDLCISELRGKTDLSTDIKSMYTSNTYAQEQQKAIEDLL